MVVPVGGALSMLFWRYVVALLCGFGLVGALSPDGAALYAFKQGLQDPKNFLENWRVGDDDPCTWFGVVCDNSTARRVTILNIPRCMLSGSIAPELGMLSNLRRLALHFNMLSGSIPFQISNCSNLRALYLQNNFLSGVIPPSLGNLLYLRRLNLSDNMLSGAIPSNGTIALFSANSFVGNPRLCGKQPLPPCANNSSPQAAQGSVPVPHAAAGGLSALKVAAIAVGAFLFVKFCLVIFFVCKWAMRNEEKQVHLGAGGKLVMFQGGSTVPSTKEILAGMGKLRRKHVIGEGGYGVVYKLTLSDDTILAVKKLKQCLESVRGFESELETLGTIKHRNLVKLRGFCTTVDVKLLIYDYLPNGTLYDHLHGKSPEKKQFPWVHRLKIAVGVARGLAYLHHGCNPRIIHRDISSSNILLDNQLEPYLSDFGLAKLVGRYDTHVTATVGGTFGYIAPEFVQTGKATDKIDVYSYGVVLLELLSRRQASDPGLPDSDLSLAGWLRQLERRGDQEDVLDTYLKGGAAKDQVNAVLELASNCLSRLADERPCMDKIVERLEMIQSWEEEEDEVEPIVSN